MDLDSIFRGMTISSTGLTAERRRLEVIAQNLANANVVAGPGGEPYRRREVVFETVLADAAGDAAAPEGSVRVKDVVPDMKTPFEKTYDPGHPLADPETGMVTHSNVNMAFEMVDLMAAVRTYEANLKSVSAFKDMVRQSLRILEA